MARTTPQDTFAEAQAAMTRGDWDGFFATIDRDDLVKIADNGVNGLVNRGAAGARVLVDLGAAPELVLREIRSGLGGFVAAGSMHHAR